MGLPQSQSPSYASIIAAWAPLDPLPTLARKLPASFLAVRVDQPPRFSVAMAAVATWWIPPDPIPILPKKVAGWRPAGHFVFFRAFAGARDRAGISGAMD